MDDVCPIDGRPISRAVHQARIQRGTPACRGCPRRDDLDNLSPRRRTRLKAVWARQRPRTTSDGDTIVCTDCNGVSTGQVERVAAAFARDEALSAVDGTERPTLCTAHDGRPLAWELYEAILRGLRLCGARRIDLGETSLPCWHRFLAERSCGGLYLGQPIEASGAVGLTFAQAPGSGRLDLSPYVGQLLASPEDVPVARLRRHAGRYEKADAEALYLAMLQPLTHGLRPLRLVVGTVDAGTVRYLARLFTGTAVRCTVCPPHATRVIETLAAHRADLGVILTENGRRCMALDETTQVIPTDRLARLLAKSLGRRASNMSPLPLGEHFPAEVCDDLIDAEPCGRFWFRTHSGAGYPDGLRVVLELLIALSQSDRPFSAVLDDDASLD